MTADVPAQKNLNPVECRDDEREISLADIIIVLVQSKWLFPGVLFIGRLPELAGDGAFKLTPVEKPATATARKTIPIHVSAHS